MAILRVLVVISVLIGGGVVIWHSLDDAHEARRSVAWPVVDGKVLAHSVQRHLHPRTGDTFEPIVWYAYAVDGREYKDSRIAWYAESFATERAAADFLNERFPVGATVAVHYDPNHPHHACLVPGGGSRAMVPVYASGMMIVVLLVVAGVHALRRPR